MKWTCHKNDCVNFICIPGSNTVCFFTVRTSVFLQCMFTIDEISQVDTIIRMHGEIYPDFFSSEVSQLCFTGNKNVKKTGWGKENLKKKLQQKKREIIQKC